MKFQPRLSPNYNARPTLEPVNILILHYTGMRSSEEALNRLCDASCEVSAHYFVDEDGSILQLIEEEYRAWHAGVSHWRGRNNLNDVSIGIEIVNPGHEFGYRAFPPAQMQAVAALCQDILRRHDIPARNVVAHSDVAPTRKEDPGELFPWEWLAEQGVGLWPCQGQGISMEESARTVCPSEPSASGASPTAEASRPEQGHDKKNSEENMVSIQKSLREYGYSIELTGEMDMQTSKVITAFQRHFRPAALTGEWDDECAMRLAYLLSIA